MTGSNLVPQPRRAPLPEKYSVPAAGFISAAGVRAHLDLHAITAVPERLLKQTPADQWHSAALALATTSRGAIA